MGLFRQPSGDITSGVIWKQLLAFFFPLWLGTFFQQLYNTVDTLVVGRLVGKTALAAVGSTAVVVNLTVGLFTGLASGAVVVSCKLDWEDGRQVYEVELRSGRTEYDFEIDAQTGSIVSRDVDYDS